MFSKIIDFYLDHIAEKQLSLKEGLVEEILYSDLSTADFNVRIDRSWPGHPEFLQSGYWKRMLKRYFLAGSHFCRNKKVLETCCGIGWGARIVSEYTNEIVAFDFDKSVIRFCRESWNDRPIDWRVGDALDFSFLHEERFDVVLGMETIEHFTYDEGCRYVENVSGCLNRGGFYIGTSYFPHEKKVAEEHCAKDSFHKHIFTLNEINEILGRYFRKHTVLKNRLFIAKK